MRPDGHPIWTSAVVAGHHHDMTAAREAHLLGALYWAASQLDLPTLADGGYRGAGQGIHVPYKQPAEGNVLGVDHLAFNALQRGLRALGERGFALHTGRWRPLQRITASPSRIGDITVAARMLTEYEQRDLHRSPHCRSYGSAPIRWVRTSTSSTPPRSKRRCSGCSARRRQRWRRALALPPRRCGHPQSWPRTDPRVMTSKRAGFRA
jgi:DDE superfamily endonuclease